MLPSDSQIARAILKTLVFFDIFDYPLTLNEIWQYLYAPGEPAASIDKITRALDSPEIKSKIGFAQGFYFLSGREANINSRKSRYLIAEPKIKKTRRLVRLIRHLGGVRAVAISNTLALMNSRREADIDLFIITQAEKAWAARFWSLLPLRFFGQRPKPGLTQDKFCLSFWVDDQNLNIAPWRMERDIYYVYWLATLMPLYNDGVLSEFWQDNQWIKDFLPNFIPPSTNRKYAVGPSWRLPIIFENSLKKIQLKIMPAALIKKSQADSTGVVIKEGVLKFHPTDNRAEIQEKFDRKLKSLNV